MEIERNENRNWVETGAVNTPGKAQQVMTCGGGPLSRLIMSIQHSVIPSHAFQHSIPSH